MKVTISLVIAIVIVSILSSSLTRAIMPLLYSSLNEGFESKNLALLGKLLESIDIVDSRNEPRSWWNRNSGNKRAIKLKGFSNGLQINNTKPNTSALTIMGVGPVIEGLRLCETDDCSTSKQWSMQFSWAGNLYYRAYPRGHRNYDPRGTMVLWINKHRDNSYTYYN